MCPFWEFNGAGIVYPFLRFKRTYNWWSSSVDTDFTHEQKQVLAKIPPHGYHYIWDEDNSHQRRFIPVRTMLSWAEEMAKYG